MKKCIGFLFYEKSALISANQLHGVIYFIGYFQTMQQVSYS